MITAEPDDSPDQTQPDQPDVRRQRSAAPGPKATSLTRNVMANWISFGTVIVSGFIVPRMINAYQGKEAVGLWDFSFSLLIYVRLTSLGISSGINRYVARNHTLQDWEGLNATVNTCLAMLSCSFVVALGVAAGLTLATPLLLANAGEQTLALARQVVLLLTVGASLKLVFGVVNGVITGCERFDILNMIRVTRDVLVLAAMLVVLALGFGIVALAWCVLLGEVCGNLVKIFVVRRLCPQLRFAPRMARWALAKDMLQFSGKTVLQGLARTGLYQGNSILVAYFLGPAALAVYSRQRVLVTQAQSFVQHFAHVIVPRSGALDARGDRQGLQDLLVRSTRYGFYISLPLLATLVILGGPLVEVWMGASYRAPLVIAVLACGHILSIPQQTAFSVLVGMGRHGIPALFDVAASLVSVSLTLVALGLAGLELHGAALAVALPVMLSGGLLAPLCACKCLGLAPIDYFRRVVLGPVAMLIPYVACLVLPSALGVTSPVTRLVAGVGCGGCVLTVLYWQWVVPEALRTRVLGLWSVLLRFRRACP